MFQMRYLLFHFLPQVLNRVEVWRIGRQLFNSQAIRMRREKLLHRLARVIPGPILDHDDVLLGVREYIEQKGVFCPTPRICSAPHIWGYAESRNMRSILPSDGSISLNIK